MNSSPGGAAAIRSGAQRKRGRFGEEEQGSQRSFRRQAETELSRLCDDEGRVPVSTGTRKQE